MTDTTNTEPPLPEKKLLHPFHKDGDVEYDWRGCPYGYTESQILAYGDARAAHAVAQMQQEPVATIVSDVDDGVVCNDVEWHVQPDDIPPGTRLYTGPRVQQADLTDAEQEVSVPISGWTTIPVGTLIFHDFKNSRWPECNNAEPGDLETLFEVSVRGDTVTLKADGFGGDPYGSGVILVNLSHWKQAWAAIAATKKDKP